MKRPSVIGDLRNGSGLTGRLLAIVMTILVLDFVINSLLFERESTFMVNAEEAAAVAGRLSVARQVLDAAPPERRPAMARQLSTRRSQIEWHPRRPVGEEPTGSVTLRGQVVAVERELADADVRLRPLPLGRNKGIAGSLLLRDGSAVVFRTTDTVSWAVNPALLVRFFIPSVLLFVLAWWLLRRSIMPLSRVVAATSHVGTDEMEPLEETGEREVRQLVRAFNRMHDRIRQLLANRTEAMLAIGHDLRTPMARLQMRLDGLDIDEASRAGISAEIAEMSDLLDSLRIYVESGEESRPAEMLDLAAMVRTQVDDGADQGLRITYSGPKTLQICAHPLSLRRAIANLIQNAMRYAGGAVISLRQRDDEVELAIADRGPGIPEDRLMEVRQPFTRLDDARGRNTSGMGLGLAIVDRIVAAEGGRFSLANRVGGGLVATIALPVRQPSSSSPPRNIS